MAELRRKNTRGVNKMDMQTLDAVLEEFPVPKDTLTEKKARVRNIVFPLSGLVVSLSVFLVLPTPQANLAVQNQDIDALFILQSVLTSSFLCAGYFKSCREKEKALLDSRTKALQERLVRNKKKMQVLGDVDALFSGLWKATAIESTAHAMFVKNLTFFFLFVAMAHTIPHLHSDTWQRARFAFVVILPSILCAI